MRIEAPAAAPLISTPRAPKADVINGVTAIMPI
jgi:hypothetical protein